MCILYTGAGGYLRIGDMGIFADLGSDGGTELRDGGDVVKIVNLHDGW